MKLRPLITLLLTVTLMVNATALAAQNEQDETPANKDVDKITAQEEREALELTARLTKRWQETEDIGPLIDEFYVSDFTQRLRHEPELIFLAQLKKEQLTPEADLDLRRHYVAVTNFLHLMLRLYAVHETIRSTDDERDVNVREIIPAEVWNVFESNPTLKALMDEETGDKANGAAEPEGQQQETEDRAEEKGIKTIEQLRVLTTALEQAVVLLRAHIRTLPLTLPADELIRSKRSESDAYTNEADHENLLKPYSYTLGEEYYGYPAGTRLICASLLPFHIDLVRVGQHLKVLSIHIEGD
ncbi:MAG TPA: hypothetical protein VF735_20225 [Pyrinomonadaceae bacterium]|jgi:hypothetical protein